ncbi:hypothetical protein D3C77_244150 [compost metagenome]
MSGALHKSATGTALGNIFFSIGTRTKVVPVSRSLIRQFAGKFVISPTRNPSAMPKQVASKRILSKPYDGSRLGSLLTNHLACAIPRYRSGAKSFPARSENSSDVISSELRVGLGMPLVHLINLSRKRSVTPSAVVFSWLRKSTNALRALAR